MLLKASRRKAMEREMAESEQPLSFFVLRNLAKPAFALANKNYTKQTTNLNDIGHDHGHEFEQDHMHAHNRSTKTIKRKVTTNTSTSLFKNFENVCLTDEERVYLNAAALGDVGILRQSLAEADEKTDDGTKKQLDVNCVDYMGRNALHLAVDSENAEAIEILMDRLCFECISEALLHAISKNLTKIVKIIIEHPNYMTHEDKIKRMDYNDTFFRNEEKSQFSPDITPIVLAAHYNNHEIIQLFLSRNHTIEKPHVISCQCKACLVKQNFDSLKRSRSRLNAYRALASPAYMALSTRDPIMTAFGLRQEMMQLAEAEKEFKNEYLALVEQCMVFACEMMDLCRGTQEVEAVLSDCLNEDDEDYDPLKRLRMAMYYEEKKFVAHANCQQHLTTIWYGSQMAFLQSLSPLQRFMMLICCVPLLPLLCLIYICAPQSRIAACMRCPNVRFASSTTSHIIFLTLLAIASLKPNESPPLSNWNQLNCSRWASLSEDDKIESLLHETLRPARWSANYVEILIVIWVSGLLFSECKMIYFSGITNHLFKSMYHLLNWTILSLYVAGYTLRLITYHLVMATDNHFNATAQAREALEKRDYQRFDMITKLVGMKEYDHGDQHLLYFIEASRFKWAYNDPEILSDVLFALANVLSIAKTTYMMPAFEILGPLQISFGRMLYDILRFLVLFLLVLFAFMIGLHNLYWYYGSHEIVLKEGETRFASEPFEGLVHTLYTLFWSMFGQIGLPNIPIRHPNNSVKAASDGMPDPNSSTAVIEAVGMCLLAIYHVMIIIVLVNMLIAMMSHSFERIQQSTDVEWKFARSKLWLRYIDDDSALPVPFNLIPSGEMIKNIPGFIKSLLVDENFERIRQGSSYTFIRHRRIEACIQMKVHVETTSYTDIMQRLVRRYLFKLERGRVSDDGTKDLFSGGLGTGANWQLDSVADPFGPAPSMDEISDSDFDSISNARQSQQMTSNQCSVRFAMPSDSLTTPEVVCQPNMARRHTRIARPGPRRRCCSNANIAFASPVNSGSAIPQITMLASSPQVASTQTIQVLTIPQMDALQRIQKIVDMRLQHVQQLVEEINVASGAHKIKEELEHVRELIDNNQSVLSSVLKALSQVQETICLLNENMLGMINSYAAAQCSQVKVTRVDFKAAEERRKPKEHNPNITISRGSSLRSANSRYSTDHKLTEQL